MRIACPIRVDPGKAKYLSQSLDKTRFIGLEGLRESAIYVKHHEFHGKVRMSPNDPSSATAAEARGLQPRRPAAVPWSAWLGCAGLIPSDAGRRRAATSFLGSPY